MGRGQRFTEEFRVEAVRQVTERGFGVKDVSERLGVSPHSLYQWIKRYGVPTEQRLVKEDRSTDVALKAAVLMAKGLIIRSAREQQRFTADLNGMDSAIARIIRQMDGFEEVNTSANTIRSGAERILNRTRLMRERIEKDLDVLSNEIQGLRNG